MRMAMSPAFNAIAEPPMTIKEPDPPPFWARAIAYTVVYGTVALGFWKFLEIIYSVFT